MKLPFTLRVILFLLMLMGAGAPGWGQNLNPGDIGFVHYNADGTDNFAFVALTDIPGNEQINFTDNGWTGTAFRTGEGIIVWTAPGGGISCGTVVEITTTPSASLGAVSESGDLNFSGGGDQILAYQGASDFIAALNNEGTTWQSGATDTNTSALPSGLTDGTNAVAISEIDNAVFGGITSGSVSAVRSALNNSSNWSGSNSTNQTFNGTFSISGCSSTTPTIDFVATTSNVSEGEGEGSHTVSVQLTYSDNSGDIVVDVATSNVDAESGDYTVTTTTLTFDNNGTNETENIDITINDDADQDDEIFEISLSLNSGSPASATVSATIHTVTILDDDSTIPVAFINEFHYDDDGTDDNEFIEVAVESSFSGSLSDFTVSFYNGSNGTVYDSETLDNFTIGSTTQGFTLYSLTLPLNGIQNGAPDGLALSYQSTLIEFISYEGVFTGSAGVANGVNSTDIGVSETNNDPEGNSLQRTGSCSGTCPNGLTWTGPATASIGSANASQAFPIELLSFSALSKYPHILLTWRTATELNNDYMAVERSADGRQFEEIGRVAGAGTTYEPQDYRFVDERPLRGINYYRLRQVDYDGTTEYHRVVAVSFDTEEVVMTLSPVPAAEALVVNLSDAFDEPSPVEVVNLVGQVVLRTQLPAGAQSFNLDVSNLQAGYYFVRIQGREPLVAQFSKR